MAITSKYAGTGYLPTLSSKPFVKAKLIWSNKNFEKLCSKFSWVEVESKREPFSWKLPYRSIGLLGLESVESKKKKDS